ncbi:penicillin-binding protein activator [Loktanella agnita]|uniref:penicillin-binding protein activator n=1 Tax=Loktanella agnita TaxID=287097 RepID=UPI003985939D
MFARFSTARKSVARFFAIASFAALAACDITLDPDANVGPQIDPNDPVKVALLVPSGSAQPGDALVARNLENAARLAIADLEGSQIELTVYNTGGNPTQAADAAVTAVNDGAQIILGPLYAEAANAAGVAVAGRNVNVLAFSNNPTIAGGNVFILGATFDNTANRMVRYAARQGINRHLIVHAQSLAGEVGRDAITRAVQSNGGTVAGIESYPLSQQGIVTATRRIVSTAKTTGAQSIFTTAEASADLPIVATMLPEGGVDPETTTFIGLTRWDTLPQLSALPGVQGGLFAMPDPATAALFTDRYTANFGERPHPLAGLSYDGIAAIGALIEAGNAQALTKAALTTPQGFRGTSGIFRLLPNGMNERGLAVATIQENQVVTLEQAPRSFGSAGF